MGLVYWLNDFVTMLILLLKYITHTPNRSIASNKTGAHEIEHHFFHDINTEFIVVYRDV